MLTSKAESVPFPNAGMTIVGLLYLLPTTAPNRQRTTTIVGHPMIGTKDQTASLHAEKHAAFVSIALAPDGAHHGESGGVLRNLEPPLQRPRTCARPLRSRRRHADADVQRTGGLGICDGGGGGGVPLATWTNLRARAGANRQRRSKRRLLAAGRRAAGRPAALGRVQVCEAGGAAVAGAR